MILHGASSPALASRKLWPLLSLNFFMADFQAGIGPFLGVFLLAYGWQSGLIGTVMTIGGVAGMLMGIPAGALIDQTRRKRFWVIVAGVSTIAASVIVLMSQEFWVVAGSQLATGVAGAVIIPAVNGITLGVVRQKGFVRQNGLNQAFNHAGNMVGAGLSGYLGWRFGYPAIFALAAVFGAMSIASVLMIPAASIDYAAARGLKEDDAGAEASGWQVLAECKPLLVLAVALGAFHLGNAAMLPLYGMAVVSNAKSNGPAFVAWTVVIAQGTMVVASLVAMRMAEAKGYWLVFLIAFIALPVRGLLASQMLVPWGVVPVQMLDGVGAGLLSVAVPGLVARILMGTGRINAGQGVIATVQGLGAAISPALGGWMAQIFGYGAAFVVLGCFALVSIGCWVAFKDLLQPACDGAPDHAPLEGVPGAHARGCGEPGFGLKRV